MHQILWALFFYCTFTLFALVGLPLTLRLFTPSENAAEDNHSDKENHPGDGHRPAKPAGGSLTGFKNSALAYVAAKPLGFLIFGYLIWLLSSLKILDFQKIGAISALFLLALTIGMAMIVKFYRAEILSTGFWRQIARVECLWLILYFAYLWLRSHNAVINGTERFMDMALFTASGKTHYFPPLDPWWAGQAINYYYYGHYLFALLANLSRAAYTLAYNFSLGLIFSAAAILSGSLTFELSRSKLFAVLAGFFVTVAGSAAYAACVLSSSAGQICSYAGSTRLYTPSYIINEIPSYSFTVGDLHAHLLALPFFLTALILLYRFWQDHRSLSLAGALVLTLATAGLVNPWDFVTLAILTAVMVITKISNSKTSDMTWPQALTRSKPMIVTAASAGLAAVILILPFILHFHSGSPGLGWAPTFAAQNRLLQGFQYPSPLKGWLGIWGAFLVIIILARLGGKKSADDKTGFASLLIITAVVLLIGVEVFFVKDIYFLANPPFFRANTVFKFGFHTWVLLAVASMLLASRALAYKTLINKFAAAMLKILIFAAVSMGLFYPYQAIKQYYLHDPAVKGTLDGLEYMQSRYPEDYQTIKWLQKNSPERAVVVEAVGDSYSDFGRVAVFTGQLDPLNWKSHEWTWRFHLPAGIKISPKAQIETGWSQVAEKADKVKRLYETADVQEAGRLMAEFNAAYVYVGQLERQAYPSLDEKKFAGIGEAVFISGQSRLYKIK